MGKRATVSQTESRRTRAAAEIRARESRERRRARLTWGSLSLALVGLIAVIAYGVQDIKGQTAITGLDAVKTFKPEAGHVTDPVTYKQSPPAGGPHNPVWLNCGIYDKKVPNENAVHSMEHGAVWITYRPDLARADIDKLKEAMPPTYGVLSPYDGLTSPVVASAWGKQLALDGPDDRRLASFIRAYAQSDDAPEPGASCTGGSDGTLPLDSAGRM